VTKNGAVAARLAIRQALAAEMNADIAQVAEDCRKGAPPHASGVQLRRARRV